MAGANADDSMSRPRWTVLRAWPAALAILVAQLVYWGLLQPLLLAPPHRPETIKTYNLRAAVLAEPSIEALQSAAFEPVELPWAHCCFGYTAFSADFSLERVPATGLGATPAVDADNVRIFINGHLIHAPGRMAMDEVTHHRFRTVLFVPPGLLRDGENTLTVMMVRTGLPYTDVHFAPLIGEYTTMMRAAGWRMFVFTEWSVIAYTIGFVLAAIAAVVLVRSEAKAFPFWVFVLALSWALLTHFYVWTDPPFDAHWRIVYYFGLTNALPVAWLNLADAWSERPLRWIAPLSVTVYAAALALIVWALFSLSAPDGFDLAGDVTNLVGLGLGTAAILRFLWHILRFSDERAAEVGIFALCISLIALDRLAEIGLIRLTGGLQLSLPLLVLALALAYLGRNIRLFQSLSTFNAKLEDEIRAREADLAEAHGREREFVRQQAHEAERQRIMRDMHDGLGSHLMSMLLAARRGGLSQQSMAEGIQTVIDEMRLMLESMDSVGESLASAFATFRQRVGPRIEAAGLTFAWSEPPMRGLPRYGPRKVLQVFRILQEAVGNALKHSGGRTISISIAESAEPGFPIRILITDDGQGFAAPRSSGRGLGNMSSRASAIGAQLDVRSDSSGTAVELLLPAADLSPAAGGA